MLKIQYASDLHLELPDNARHVAQHPLQVTGDILVLAGDIAYLGKDYAKHPFWDWASEHYRHVAVIPGNHEFYGGFDLENMHDGWQLKLRCNVTCHYNDCLTFGDTELILSPMWASVPIEYAVTVQEGINDFRLVRCGGKDIELGTF